MQPFVELVVPVRLLAKPGAAATAMPGGAALVAPATALEVALEKRGHRETTRADLVTTEYVTNQIEYVLQQALNVSAMPLNHVRRVAVSTVRPRNRHS